jgi:hypothetical protein
MRKLAVLLAAVGALLAAAPPAADAGVEAARGRVALAQAKYDATVTFRALQPITAYGDTTPRLPTVCVTMDWGWDWKAYGCDEASVTVDPMMRRTHLIGKVHGTLQRFFRNNRDITIRYDLSWEDMGLPQPSADTVLDGCGYDLQNSRTGAIMTVVAKGTVHGVVWYDFDGHHEVKFTDLTMRRAELGQAVQVDKATAC